MVEKLGIIAGAGELPALLARAAVTHERQPVIIQITKSDAQRFAGIACELHTYGVGPDSKDHSNTSQFRRERGCDHRESRKKYPPSPLSN